MNRSVALALSVFLALSLGWAASPPQLVNYQGVLRDAAGSPLSGTYDMTFRFYDASVNGTLLLTDAHLATGGAAVVVSNGLFNTQLGGGALTSGTESSLLGVFANHTTVYLSVQVGSETLSPRVQIVSAAFAQAAHTLDGSDASAFAAASHNHDATAITSGTLAYGRGGTGLSAPGTSGNVLTSNGTSWVSQPVPSAGSQGAVVGAANSTLTRYGAGTAADPYTLALNVGNSNSWSGQQSFGNATLFPGTSTWDASGRIGVGTRSPAGLFDVQTTGERLDQASYVHGTSPAANGTWQSFTAAVSGNVTKLLLAFTATSSRSGTVTLYAGQGTGGAVLSSAPFNSSNGEWTTIPFSSPPAVNAGSTYTIGVVCDPGLLWMSSSSDSYTRGVNSLGTGDFRFKEYVNGSSSLLTLTADGSLGVGTNAPSAQLTVDGEPGSIRAIDHGGAGYGGVVELQNTSDSGNYGDLRFLDYRGTVGTSVSAYSNGLCVKVNGTSRFGVSSTGLVGIGMNCGSADYALDVAGDIHASGRFVDSSLAAGTAGQLLQATGTGTSWVNPSTINAGWIISGNNEYASVPGNVGIGTSSPGWPLDVQASYAVGRFTTTSNTYGAVLELRNLTASPSQIGAINFSNSTGFPGQIAYYNNNDLTFRTNGIDRVKMGAGGGSPYYLQVLADSAAKPSTNTWTIASDRRLKKDIVPFSDGLSVIERIHPISYHYNGLAGMPTEPRGIGVIAQDMKEVAPYTVGTFLARLTDKDDKPTELYDFNSHALTFVLINAVKELDARTKALAGVTPSTEPAVSGLAVKPAAGLARSKPTDVFQDEQGNVYGRSFRPSQPDLATLMPVSEAVESGDVVVADDVLPGRVRLATSAADPKVVGIATGEPGVGLDGRDDDGSGTPKVFVVYSGIARCKVDASGGPIAVGDLLTTSAVPGRATRAANPATGTVLGKALEPLSGDTGVIRIMVMMR